MFRTHPPTSSTCATRGFVNPRVPDRIASPRIFDPLRLSVVAPGTNRWPRAAPISCHLLPCESDNAPSSRRPSGSLDSQKSGRRRCWRQRNEVNRRCRCRVRQRSGARLNSTQPRALSVLSTLPRRPGPQSPSQMVSTRAFGPQGQVLASPRAHDDPFEFRYPDGARRRKGEDVRPVRKVGAHEAEAHPLALMHTWILFVQCWIELR